MRSNRERDARTPCRPWRLCSSPRITPPTSSRSPYSPPSAIASTSIVNPRACVRIPQGPSLCERIGFLAPVLLVVRGKFVLTLASLWLHFGFTLASLWHFGHSLHDCRRIVSR